MSRPKASATPPIGPTGWIKDPAEVGRIAASLPMPLFGAATPHLAGSGEGRTALLYKAIPEVNGGHDMDYPAQTIGDCVSHAFAHGIDILAAVEIAIGHEREEFRPAASEVVYALARVDIGGQRGSYQDGAVGAWAAKSVNTMGTISREVLGPYDGSRAKDWGANGLPKQYRDQLGHMVKTVSLVTTLDELDDALTNGYPVTVCSNQGFTMSRDRDGFCAPQGEWGHCMLICGVRTDDHPGYCIMQSWGPTTPTGPRTLDQPSNSFWIKPPVMARMLQQRDSWALSSFDGYEARDLPEGWSYMGAC